MWTIQNYCKKIVDIVLKKSIVEILQYILQYILAAYRNKPNDSNQT